METLQSEPVALNNIFADEATVDNLMSEVDRYQRKPSGTSDQGRSED